MTVPKLTTPRSGWGGRGYKIPGRETVYPGVTTINNFAAKDGLLQWIADQTAAFAVANIAELMHLEDAAAWGFLRFYWSRKPELVGSGLRLHHEGVKNDAAELGTNIHEWMEAIIDGTYDPPGLISQEAEQMSDAASGWLDEHAIVSHNSEFTVVNDEEGYAGTGDADWTITCIHEPVVDLFGSKRWCLGSTPGPYRTLVDFKSSRHTWPEHGMQLAALSKAPVTMREVFAGYEGAQKAEKTEKGEKVVSYWVEEKTPQFERVALLHLRPYDLDTQGEVIEPFAVLVDRTDDLDLYWTGFQGALRLAWMNKELKRRAKARGTEE